MTSNELGHQKITAGRITWSVFCFNRHIMAGIIKMPTTCSYDKKQSVKRMFPHADDACFTPVLTVRQMSFFARLFPIKKTVRPLSHVVSCSTRKPQAFLSPMEPTLVCTPGIDGFQQEKVVKSHIDVFKSLY